MHQCINLRKDITKIFEKKNEKKRKKIFIKFVILGTSNWSGDYFVNTAGIGFVVRSLNETSSPTIVSDLQEAFDRDWASEYATPISSIENINS